MAPKRALKPVTSSNKHYGDPDTRFFWAGSGVGADPRSKDSRGVVEVLPATNPEMPDSWPTRWLVVLGGVEWMSQRCVLACCLV